MRNTRVTLIQLLRRREGIRERAELLGDRPVVISGEGGASSETAHAGLHAELIDVAEDQHHSRQEPFERSWMGL